ncbi:MAG TPA: hypothetical protein DCP93_14220 [Lachnospiraceae bacterium]|nr:hypothetical protein [Lachnospiraceae bacterium]
MKKSTKAWSMKMRLALLALAALVWIAVPVSARAEGETVDTWDGTTIADKFAAGDGTQGNPFQIETAAQLAHFAKTVNEGEAYLHKYIVLTADIDLANKEWTPIGNYSNPFKGNFNGDNHTVTGMQISGESDRVGLFGECTKFNDNSAIKNITVKDSVICGKNFVGAIVGYAEEINIENCRSIGNTINGKTDVGGICGKIGGYSVGKVSQCYNSSKVTGRGRTGGIAGMGGIAENCLNTGEIMIINKPYQSACGGIFGIFDDTTTSATITACVNLGKVSGGESFGGIVGSTDSESTGHISNCYYNMDAITGGFDAGTALTAGQLCGALPEGFDSANWKEGSVDTSNAVATDTGSRFGTAAGTYINLTKVAEIGETKTASVPVYNYVTTNGDDWDTYTLITTAEEFAAIGQDRDAAKWSANYVLGNDIDLSGVELSSIGDPEIPYIGKFSGDGHTISHVDMTKEDGVYSSGLFAQIGNSSGKSGKVILLLAANGDIVSSYSETGGICGNLSAGEIYGCSFTGTVKGYTAGGICGNAGQDTKISQCFFAGDVQGSSAAGICGRSGAVVDIINHCISIATIDTAENDAYLAGITNSQDYGVTNCYFNNDICNVEDKYQLGRSTQQLTSSSFFKELKDKGFDQAIWTKKANDKENGIAYYPSLGENNAVGVNYTTGLQFERADTNTPTYGQDITFNAKALVNFATDGQPISAEDTEGSFEIRIGDTTVVNAAEFGDGTATYNARTAGETTFTLVYKGNDNSFFSEKTKNLTVNIAPAELTVSGRELAHGTYGDKLCELKVEFLTALLGSETIDGTWQIIGDEIPCVGDDGTYTATFTPAQHPEYYQPLTAPVKLAIEKAKVSAIPMQNLYYSWAAKGEKEVQIPGLPEDRGTTELISMAKADDAKVLATDPAIRYSEGKLIFTLGENTVEDIGKTATLSVELQSQNYENFYVGVHILRTAKADREDTPDPDAFDMTFTVSGNDLAAQITTDRTDVEFSFDGTDWGQTKSAGVGHNEKVTARIRYAETDDYNASPAVSKTWNSGHGPLNRHDRVEPTCQAEGSIEYWTCDVCGLYFASADGSKSITATEIVLPKTDHSWAEGYLSDMTGHWHKCGVCGITSNTEKHSSGGAATTERAEICTVCGYEIAPKKPAASNDDDDDDDDDSSQASNTDQKATGAATPPAATATPATPGVVKPSVIPVPPTTPAADENRKEDAAKPSGEAQDTQESSGEAPQEERIDSMTAQTSGSQESGTEQITETSGKGTNAGRVAAAAAAGAVVVGGGGAAVYVTMIKGKFKFK